MTVGVILYHKNARRLYEQSWIDQCVASIRDQTYQDFTVLELDYGGTGERLYPGSRVQVKVELPTYANAQNLLLDLAFASGVDYAFNINIDDYYAPQRFERQLEYLENGADLVSTYFEFVNEQGTMATFAPGDISITEELDRDHNVICHPSVAYSRNFWMNCSRYNPAEVPEEDLGLWKREVRNFNFQIVPEVLTYCRHHTNNASDNETSR